MTSLCAVVPKFSSFSRSVTRTSNSCSSTSSSSSSSPISKFCFTFSSTGLIEEIAWGGRAANIEFTRFSLWLDNISRASRWAKPKTHITRTISQLTNRYHQSNTTNSLFYFSDNSVHLQECSPFWVGIFIKKTTILFPVWCRHSHSDWQAL